MLYVTVQPADATVTLDDCVTMRLDQDNSRLIDQAGYAVTPSAPCGGQLLSRWVPKSSLKTTSGTNTSGLYGMSPMGSMACPIDAPLVARVLRIAGGLETATSGEIPLLDYSRNGIVDVPDAVDILRNPCVRLVDVHTFSNGLDASPAIFDMDGDGLPEVILAVDQLLYGEPSNALTDPNNDNQTYV